MGTERDFRRRQRSVGPSPKVDDDAAHASHPHARRARLVAGIGGRDADVITPVAVADHLPSVDGPANPDPSATARLERPTPPTTRPAHHALEVAAARWVRRARRDPVL